MCVLTGSEDSRTEDEKTNNNGVNNNHLDSNNCNSNIRIETTDSISNDSIVTTTKSGLTKAKEKYMRIHEQMLINDKKLLERRDAAERFTNRGEKSFWTCTAKAGCRIAEKAKEIIYRWQDYKIYK